MRSDRVLAIILAVLGGGAILLMLNDRAGRTFGLDNNDFAQLIYLGAIALVVGMAVVSRARPGGNMLVQVALWLAIVIGLVVGYKLYTGEPLFPADRPLPPASGAGISASLVDGIHSSLHFGRPLHFG
ncbi:MAG: hypothetical protein M9924_15870 [Rhizobiaceae bacterium]|nr:hypothetical protein [Rhizobiaceae bacterium]